MRVVSATIFSLWIVAAGIMAALPEAARAAEDAPGCADLKLFPRLEGCVIVECSAKQHDSFDSADETAGLLDVGANALTYSCPASTELLRVKRELEAEIRKAGYQNVAEDKTDPDNPVITARRGSHWLRAGVSSDDGGTGYWLIRAESSAERFNAEACGQPPVPSPLKQCQVVECTSKSEDSVAIRTAQKEETSLAGDVQTATLVCPASGRARTLQAAEDELRRSGFEILFSDRDHPESGWITGRAGKRWVELVGAPEGESVSYTLTVVPAAEVLTAANPEPEPPTVAVAAQTPAPSLDSLPRPTVEPAPTPMVSEAMIAALPKRVPAPPPKPPRPSAIASAPPAPVPVFIPPKPILQAPIEPTPDRIQSVVGNVAINLLVDVSEDGVVTNAVLTGRITKDVLKLEDAALEAMSHWRFEPARQDGRIVPCVKIPVQMHFRGRPWRF